MKQSLVEHPRKYLSDLVGLDVSKFVMGLALKEKVYVLVRKAGQKILIETSRPG